VISKWLPFVLSIAIVLLVATSVRAHHGTGLYYGASPVTLKGIVTEFAWENPHVQIYFDVKDAKGNIVHWSCETLSPGKLTRSGWTRNSVKVGDSITITVSPAKTGAPVGSLKKLVLPDGTALTALADDNYVAPKE